MSCLVAGSIAIYRTALVDPTQIDLETVREDQLTVSHQTYCVALV